MKGHRHFKQAFVQACVFASAVLCLFVALGSEGAAQTRGAAARARQSPTYAAPRARLSLNASWKFNPADAQGAEVEGFDDSKWEGVNLPHTWNAEDTQDDAPGYRMGVGWYRKVLDVESRLKGKRLFLYFEGANQVADVFVNGRQAGRHKGGYTAFAFEITELVRFGRGSRNVVAVKVDNSADDEIPPAPSADFNLYGGIYRDVWLVATESVHIQLLDYASPGVYLDTPAVSAESASVIVRGAFTNSTEQPRRIRVVNTVYDASGRAVTSVQSVVPVGAREEASFRQTSDAIQRPHLWSPDAPYLYAVRTQLYDGAKLVDEVENPLGFRWFGFDADRGFSLNGEPLKLHGVNRHQDYPGLGNAVPNELLVKDLEAVKASGMNCVLLAHYPHDPVVLEAADRLGLIVWEEVPIVREISTGEEFARNCRTMLTEMIRQHYNHPSILMWCYMNEIFLRPRNEPDYVRKVVELARSLEHLARSEDPSRVTVISVHRPVSGSDIYDSSGLTQIPQVVGWHMYFGWYYGSLQDLGGFLDAQHRRFPDRKLFVSEYGADMDVRIHSLRPMMGDATAEWAHLYHTSYVRQIEARPYLAGSAVWAQNDFGTEARGGSVPHLNTKGIFSYDRKPKDIYYYYKALLSPEPVLRVATRDWATRAGAGAHSTGGEQLVTQPVMVYTNLPAVELLVNGNSLGTKPADASRYMTWDVPFRAGTNVIEARGRAGGRIVSDKTEVRFIYRAQAPADPSARFESLAVNVGSNAQFVDAHGTVWEADQPYRPGGWGHVGGVPGSATSNVLDSPDDPLFQTLRQGVKAYRFDVPDGSYEVELRFLEHRPTKPGGRVFGIALNGKTVVEALDLAKDYGEMRAVSKTFQVSAARGQGVTIDFNPVAGDAVLSAVLIHRLR